MKKAFKIIAILLVLVMITGVLASCGGNNDNSNDAAGNNNAGQGSSSAGAALAFQGRDFISDNPIKIMVIIKSSGFVAYRLYVMALEEQATMYSNVSLDFKDSEFDTARQITLIEEAVTQGYDAIILEAMDPIALNGAIENAEKAGVPVITCNGPEPTAVHSYHISSSDYATGWVSGEWMDKLTKGIDNRTTIILDCPALQKPGVLMGAGFEDYLATTDITLIEPPIGIENWSPENAQIAMRDMLTKYGPGEITMVYCVSDDIAVGAVQAIEAAGRTGEILIWGFMGYPSALEAIKEGKMAGTMFSDTYVEFSNMFYTAMLHIVLGLNAYSGDYDDTPWMQLPSLPVTADNVDDIMAVSRWYS